MGRFWPNLGANKARKRLPDGAPKRPKIDQNATPKNDRKKERMKDVRGEKEVEGSARGSAKRWRGRRQNWPPGGTLGSLDIDFHRYSYDQLAKVVLTRPTRRGGAAGRGERLDILPSGGGLLLFSLPLTLLYGPAAGRNRPRTSARLPVHGGSSAPPLSY